MGLEGFTVYEYAHGCIAAMPKRKHLLSTFHCLMSSVICYPSCQKPCSLPKLIRCQHDSDIMVFPLDVTIGTSGEKN